MSEDQSSQNQPSFSRTVPEGDNRERAVCDTCGFVQYENPKIVAGSVVYRDDRILLCKRAIEPRLGFWTLPAGYMELQETTEEAARREALEEACADIEIEALLAVYNIPRISQVQLIYRAKLGESGFSAGPESLEVDLFRWEDIPWRDLAFPSVHWSLRAYEAAPKDGPFAPFTNPDDGQTDKLPPGI